MITNPAIVVVAYNRPEALSRLLNSLAAAHYSATNVPLIISIDKSETNEVVDVAKQFEWNKGEKTLIVHPVKLGLKEHIFKCGALSSEYETIIMLEDDLMVSPYFYDYSCNVSDYYQSDENIAGISLYNYKVAENCYYPFKPIDEESDVYFMQIASSWGQIVNKIQWNNFINWYNQNTEIEAFKNIPTYLLHWGKHSWKKHFIHYLIDQNKFFVFPRLSLSTNFEEIGTNSKTKNVFQVPLQINKKVHQFIPLEKAFAKYDSWFELKPKSITQFNPRLEKFDFEVDLLGTKQLDSIEAPYILTSQIANSDERIEMEGSQVNESSFEISFDNQLFPIESNILLNLEGKKIRLYPKGRYNLKPQKLPFHNYLNPQSETEELLYSIIIPVINFDKQTLTKTIESIGQQDFRTIECLIIGRKEDENQILNLFSYISIPYKYIIANEKESLDHFISKGIQNCKGAIVCWLYPGTILMPDAIKKVNFIFKSYLTIGWIYELQDDTKDQDNTTDRIIAAKAYDYFEKTHLYNTLCLHFIRIHYVKEFIESNSLAQVYFNLVKNYLAYGVVDQWFRSTYIQVQKANDQEYKEILTHFNDLKQTKTITHLLANFAFRTKLLGKHTKLVKIVIHNYPDILRYDSVHQSYFLTKY